MCGFGISLLFPTSQRTKNWGLCGKQERRWFCERRFNWHWKVSCSGHSYINLDVNEFPLCLWQLLPSWFWRYCVKSLPCLTHLEGSTPTCWLFEGLVNVLDLICKSRAPVGWCKIEGSSLRLEGCLPLAQFLQHGLSLFTYKTQFSEILNLWHGCEVLWMFDLLALGLFVYFWQTGKDVAL